MLHFIVTLPESRLVCVTAPVLFFTTLVFYKMSFNLGFSYIFSWLYQGFGFGGRRLQRWGALFSASCHGSLISMRLNTSDVDLDLLVQVVSVSSPHCRVVLFSFFLLSSSLFLYPILKHQGFGYVICPTQPQVQNHHKRWREAFLSSS